MAQHRVRNKIGGKTRIIVVDDHPIIRKALSQLVDNEKDLTICGQAEDAPEAMKLIRAENPDMAMVDISLRRSSGLDLIKDIKAQYPDLPVLAFSMHDESLYAERALKAGARGYIMKDEAIKNLISAIRKVLSGQIYISDNMSARMMYELVGSKSGTSDCSVDCLSDREMEVFLLIGKGYKTRQISEQLKISVKTVETYRAHIKEKLNLIDASELLQYAIQWANV